MIEDLVVRSWRFIFRLCRACPAALQPAALQHCSLAALQPCSLAALQPAACSLAACSLAALQPCSLEALQPYSLAACSLAACSLTALQPYSLTALQPYSLAALQSCRLQPCLLGMAMVTSMSWHLSYGAERRAVLAVSFQYVSTCVHVSVKKRPIIYGEQNGWT